MSAHLLPFTAGIVAPAMGATPHSVFDISPRSRRTRAEAVARTGTIYLAHTVAGLSLRQLEGLMWIERRELRRSVRLIEEAREDAAFDAVMARLEDAVREGAFG
ncbi:hypothetical protein [Maricaulis sp.]|uniref:hypothetical protein n=1 Tax=Maricaulis sp. TaxID=1486257 RepID=UPI003298E505